MTESSTRIAPLLTPEEAARFLGLDRVGLKNPGATLTYLRRTRQIGFVTIAGKVMFTKKHLEDFISAHSIEPISTPTPRYD